MTNGAVRFQTLSLRFRINTPMHYLGSVSSFCLGVYFLFWWPADSWDRSILKPINKKACFLSWPIVAWQASVDPIQSVERPSDLVVCGSRGICLFAVCTGKRNVSICCLYWKKAYVCCLYRKKEYVCLLSLLEEGMCVFAVCTGKKECVCLLSVLEEGMCLFAVCTGKRNVSVCCLYWKKEYVCLLSVLEKGICLFAVCTGRRNMSVCCLYWKKECAHLLFVLENWKKECVCCLHWKKECVHLLSVPGRECVYY